ncbi:MAG: serine/threonine protein kinase [Sarcina sp.]
MENLEGIIIEKKYQLVEKVGKGGMGAVYLANDLKLNTYWAVKVIRKGKDSGDLLAEPNMLKVLQHPMLPRITDISESDKYFFIVMDFVNGKTLENIAQSVGKIKEETVIEWAKQICNALDYLHNLKPNPIIYRDMKPENVMLTKEGTIKVIDFGIAREFKIHASEDTNYLGTRGYAAPEQYRISNSQTDSRTDIYGLGVTMYRLLTNKTPDEPPYEIKPVRMIDSKLSEGIEHIVIKCTALDPNLRYNNVREVLHDLDNVKNIGSKVERANRIRRIKMILTIIIMIFSISTISSGLESYKKAIIDEKVMVKQQSVNKDGILKMTLGSFGLIISGIFCYRYIKEGIQIKRNKIQMRNTRKSLYLKNEMNISKQEIKSFNYDTDYLDEVVYRHKEKRDFLDGNNDTDFLSDTDFLDDFNA